MKVWKIFGCMAAALVLMGCLYRPGVRVIVCGNALPGVYDPATVTRCARNAHAAAEEICRSEAQPNYRLIPVLTARWTAPREIQLTRVLLESYEGVQRVYTLRAGGEDMGSVETVVQAYALCTQYAHLPLTIVPTYTYETGESAQAVMERLENYEENYQGPF